jgi:polyhydroxybutyrate depolymerase
MALSRPLLPVISIALLTSSSLYAKPTKIKKLARQSQIANANYIEENFIQDNDGCSVEPTDTGVKTIALQVGNTRRTMIRVVSPSLQNTRAHALVIGFHGFGLDGTSPRMHHKWEIVEELGKDDAVFVYPNALGGSWNPYLGSPDLALFDAIVKSISEKYCIDKRRVFVHGFSNGGFFVNGLVAARPNDIRGVISVAGGGNGSRKPAIVIHGQSDSNVGYYPSAPNLVNSYAAANGCKMPVNFNAMRVDACQQLEGCPAEYPVWFCPWRGNHHWPHFTLPLVWQFISSQK